MIQLQLLGSTIFSISSIFKKKHPANSNQHPSAHRNREACAGRASASWMWETLCLPCKGLTESLLRLSQNRCGPLVWELRPCCARFDFPDIFVTWISICIYESFFICVNCCGVVEEKQKRNPIISGPSSKFHKTALKIAGVIAAGVKEWSLTFSPGWNVIYLFPWPCCRNGRGIF